MSAVVAPNAGLAPPSSNGRGLPKSTRLTREAAIRSSQPPKRQEVLTQWGDWIKQTHWDWWVTLTFNPGQRPSGSATHSMVGWALSDRYWGEWLNRLGADETLYWLRGREPNPWRRGTHFHALVGGVSTDVVRTRAWADWSASQKAAEYRARQGMTGMGPKAEGLGMCRVEPYDPRRGAGYYVSKYVVKELGDIRFSENAKYFVQKESAE